MIGNTYGRWHVISSAETRNGKKYVLAKCVCGTERPVKLSNLVLGLSQSCGCYSADRARKHGQSKSGTYKSWQMMINRCTRGYPCFAKYAAVDVAPEWLSFESFYADMGDRPDGTSIDRIDNTKGYNANNCRWASDSIQVRNRSVTVLDDNTVALIKTLFKYGVSSGKIAKTLNFSRNTIKGVTSGINWKDVACIPV